MSPCLRPHARGRCALPASFASSALLGLFWLLLSSAAHGEATEATLFFHAPIGVSDIIPSEETGWDLGYRYSRIDQRPNRKKRDDLGTDDVLADGYAVANRDRELNLHRFALRFTPIARVTLSAELPVYDEKARYRTSTDTFAATSSGVGDLQLGLDTRFMRKGTEVLWLGVGVSAPTGSIDERDDFGGSGRQLLPYAMQRGTGSWALSPRLTYLGTRQRTSWGAQFRGTYPLERNDQGYKYSSRMDFTGWLAHDVGAGIDLSVRMAWTHWDRINGRDDRLIAGLVPSTDTRNEGGNRLDLGPGVSLPLPGLADARVAFEALWPIYQNLHGPQLAANGILHAGCTVRY